MVRCYAPIFERGDDVSTDSSVLRTFKEKMKVEMINQRCVAPNYL